MVFHSPFSHPAQEKYAKDYWGLENNFEVIFSFISIVVYVITIVILIKKYDQIYKSH